MSTLLLVFLIFFLFVSPHSDENDDFDDEDSFQVSDDFVVEEEEKEKHHRQDSQDSSLSDKDLLISKPKNENYVVVDDRPIIQRFGMELAFIVVVVIYFANFKIGQKQNEKIAEKWIRRYYPLFKSQFARVKIDANGMLLKEYEHVFKYYGTGRRYINGVLMSMRLKKRHDLLSVIMDLFSSQPDIMEVDIFHDSSAKSIILSLFENKNKKKYLSEATDVGTFCSKSQLSGLADRFVFFSEYSAINKAIFSPQVISLINSVAKYIKIIHISDKSPYRPQLEQTTRITFELPQDLELIDPIFELVFLFIDTLGRLSIPSSIQEDISTRRVKLLKKKNAKKIQQARENAAAAQRAEKLKNEQERISQLSPRSRAREEEKLRKRIQKKKLGRFKGRTVQVAG